MWYFILGLLIGVFLGRAYGWMKYHYPEAQALIRLKVAQRNAEIAKYEAIETDYKLKNMEKYERIANDH